MTICCGPLIKNKQAITYVDDRKMRSQILNTMSVIVDHIQNLQRPAVFKGAEDKAVFLKKFRNLVWLLLPKASNPSQNWSEKRLISNTLKRTGFHENPWKSQMLKPLPQESPHGGQSFTT